MENYNTTSNPSNINRPAVFHPQPINPQNYTVSGHPNTGLLPAIRTISGNTVGTPGSFSNPSSFTVVSNAPPIQRQLQQQQQQQQIPQHHLQHYHHHAQQQQPHVVQTVASPSVRNNGITFINNSCVAGVGNVRPTAVVVPQNRPRIVARRVLAPANQQFLQRNNINYEYNNSGCNSVAVTPNSRSPSYNFVTPKVSQVQNPTPQELRDYHNNKIIKYQQNLLAHLIPQLLHHRALLQQTSTRAQPKCNQTPKPSLEEKVVTPITSPKRPAPEVSQKFANLTVDQLLHIFSFVNVKMLGNVACVSSHLQRIVLKHRLFKRSLLYWVVLDPAFQAQIDAECRECKAEMIYTRQDPWYRFGSDLAEITGHICQQVLFGLSMPRLLQDLWAAKLAAEHYPLNYEQFPDQFHPITERLKLTERKVTLKDFCRLCSASYEYERDNYDKGDHSPQHKKRKICASDRSKIAWFGMNTENGERSFMAGIVVENDVSLEDARVVHWLVFEKKVHIYKNFAEWLAHSCHGWRGVLPSMDRKEKFDLITNWLNVRGQASQISSKPEVDNNEEVTHNFLLQWENSKDMGNALFY